MNEENQNLKHGVDKKNSPWRSCLTPLLVFIFFIGGFWYLLIALS